MCDNKVVFEDAIIRLEEIVQILDDGQESLDKSLALFEEGVKLARACSGILEDTKGRVAKLVTGADGIAFAESLDL